MSAAKNTTASFRLAIAATLLVTGCAPRAEQTTGTSTTAAPGSQGQIMIPAPSVTSQQQAQETLYGYMRKTLQELPAGISFEWAHPWQGGSNSACDDRIDQENAPITYADWRGVRAPAGSSYDELINKAGEIWKGWGWRVVERDGFNKPNRYAASPDGYILSLEAGNPAGYPPVVLGRTPCFPPRLRDDHVPVPKTITRDKLDYDEPSESAEPDRPSNLFNW